MKHDRDAIYTLIDAVRNHDDFAGGTIFTRDDVADALYEPAAGSSPYDLLPGGRRAVAIAAVTDEQMGLQNELIRRWILDCCQWRDELREWGPESSALPSTDVERRASKFDD